MKTLPKSLIAAGIILFTGVLNVFNYLDPNLYPNVKGDAAQYIQLSKDLFKPVLYPFALRLLSPFTVKTFSQFHPDVDTGWLVLTCTSIFLSLFLFFHLLNRCFKLSFYTSLIFTLFLAYTHAYTLFNYWDYWLVDPLNNLFILLAIYLALTERPILFFLTIVIGAINKETILFLTPLYPIVTYMQSQKTNWRNPKLYLSLVGLILTAVLYLTYRQFVLEKIGNPPGYQLFQGPEGKTVAENVRFAMSWQKDQFVIYHVFDFLWVFFGLSLYQLYKQHGFKHKLIVISIYLLIINLFGRFFATDANRIFVTTAPLVVGLAAIYAESWTQKQHRGWLLLLLLIYISSQLGWIDRYQIVWLNLAVIALILFLDNSSNKPVALANP